MQTSPKNLNQQKCESNNKTKTFKKIELENTNIKKLNSKNQFIIQ